MKKPVQLMLTCLCDSFYGEVGIATARVLEHLGCEVQFPKDQTCCGQPPFNSGDWDHSRSVATHCQGVFGKADIPTVAPSASCTAMVREGYAMLFPDKAPFPIYELSEFMHQQLDLAPIATAKPYPHRVAYHRACHGRSIGLDASQEHIMNLVPGLEMIPFLQAEQCCGFGGAFCVTHGTISEGIGLEKLKQITDSGAKEIVTGDMGCALHLQGLINRHKMDLKIRHYVEILAEVLA